jgi:hypothetical protein
MQAGFNLDPSSTLKASVKLHTVDRKSLETRLDTLRAFTGRTEKGRTRIEQVCDHGTSTSRYTCTLRSRISLT